jgi:hypothetical protein
MAKIATKDTAVGVDLLRPHILLQAISSVDTLVNSQHFYSMKKTW